MNRGVLSIGSNIDPEFHIAEARRSLKEMVRIVSESRFVKTKAVMPEAKAEFSSGKTGYFINGAVLIETEMEKGRLESLLKKLEKESGRVRTGDKFAPRTLDIDVVIWNGKIIDQDVHQREYLRRLVKEICPEVIR
jgi:2-amino-4-hydroxy-6-hydroxymethyldihydropteridine diphosphokinase